MHRAADYSLAVSLIGYFQGAHEPEGIICSDCVMCERRDLGFARFGWGVTSPEDFGGLIGWEMLVGVRGLIIVHLFFFLSSLAKPPRYPL